MVICGHDIERALRKLRKESASLLGELKRRERCITRKQRRRVKDRRAVVRLKKKIGDVNNPFYTK